MERDPIADSDQYETDEEIREQLADLQPNAQSDGQDGMTGQQGQEPGAASEVPVDETWTPTGTGNPAAGVQEDSEGRPSESS